jgi:amino acid adenylation domain-containing protein
MTTAAAQGQGLTRSQELIWLGQRMAVQSPMNNMAFAFTFREKIDIERMQLAFTKLVDTCDAMRTVFVAEGDSARQRVLPSLAYNLPFHDFTEQQDSNEAVERAISVNVAKVFNLDKRLFDAALYKVGDDCFVLYLNQHHLITDGWGYSVQLDYLLAVYRGEAPEDLPAFADYVAGQSRTEKQGQLSKEWADRAADFPTPPALFGRVNQMLSAESTRYTVQLPALQCQGLRDLCMTPEVRSWTVDLSLFTLFTTALFAYTYRISGQQNLTIGAPAHNRMTPSDKLAAGLFMELFPLNVEVDPADTFGSLLQKVKAESMSFLRYAQPGTSSADTGRSFNVVLNYINRAFAAEQGPEFTSEWLHPGETEPGHHFKLQVYDFDGTGQMTLCFDMNNAVVERPFQAGAVQGFLGLLDDMMTDLSAPVAGVTAGDEQQLEDFNVEDDSYRKGVSVVDLIDEKIKERGDSVAVRFEEQTLTYRELDERSNQLANHLAEQGVGREDLVAVSLDRSLEMMVGLLGILKAGAAYLPVDPGFPAERIAFLCAPDEVGGYAERSRSTGAKKVLTTAKYVGLFSGFDDDFAIVLDDGADWQSTASSSPSPHLRPRPENLMYVLYTSGSTGKPKGVMNQHDGLVNRLLWTQKQFQLRPDVDVVLQKTTFTFDVSVWEFFWPLIVGCELVFARPGGEKDDDYLRRTIAKYGVTTLHFVPPMLEMFLLKTAELPSLKRVICSGEALTVNQVNTFRQAYPHAGIHNLYGPTEAAIDVTHWPAPSGTEPAQHVPIGRPIDNTPIRIYGPNGERRPVGVPGELYIGGVQVARGYLGRPDLTAEKFVDLDGQRWYRTGDLVRWLPDGNIDFLGRIDSQVKLRGFRIELGEIESLLLQAPGISQSVVQLRKDGKGEPALAAYLVGSADALSLRDFLISKVPAYMVPASFVILPEMPLLRNGKVDRKALPDPTFDAASAAGEAPQGDFEEMIHETWAGVFQLEAIGRKAHFLDLGGHSLTGIRLMSRINEAFELNLPANTVFRFPTIAELAGHIERTIRDLLAAMDKGV